MIDYTKLCMNCFRELHGAKVCPHCGYEQNTPTDSECLPPGTEIAERFLIGRVRGQDETGIVYNVYDMKKESRRRMREFFPSEDAQRMPDGSVQPLPGHEASFNEALEAMRLNAESSETDEKKYIFVKMNGTGYFIERKVKSSAPKERQEEEPEEEEKSRLPVLLIVMCVVIIGAVIAAIFAIKSCSNSDKTDSTQEDKRLYTVEPTYNPVTEPTVTPYVSDAGFGDITHIGSDWMSQQGGESMAWTDSTATPTPTPTATPSPTPYSFWDELQNEINNSWGQATVPVYTATPAPVRKVVNANSTPAAIKSLQWQLIELGWLDYDTPNGVYDTATKNAVKAFQSYMNSQYRAGLTVDGICGPATFNYLDNYAISQNPSPQVTTEPANTSINTNSPSYRIRDLQIKLITLGWLEGDPTGVYNESTTSAVMAFQNYVNSSTGAQILNVTGVADPNTQTLLTYERYKKPSVGPTATPTPAPTNDPYDETDLLETLPEPVMISVTADQALVYARASQNAQPQGVVYKGSRFIKLAENKNWAMIVGENGSTGFIAAAAIESVSSGESEETGGITPSSTADEIRSLQSMLVARGWLDETQVDGSYGVVTRNAVTTFQSYVNYTEGMQVLNVTGLADESTLDMLLDEKYYNPAKAPTAMPTAAPTNTPEPTATFAPFDPSGEEKPVVVSDDSLLVFSQPKYEQNLCVGSVPKNTPLYVISQNGTWAYIRNDANNRGYVLLSGLTLAAPTGTPTAAPTATPTPAPTSVPFTYLDAELRVVVTADRAEVYKEPAIDPSKLLGTMGKNVTMTMLAYNDEWALVRNDRGDTGYTLLSAIAVAETPATSVPTSVPTNTPAPTNVPFSEVTQTIYVRVTSERANLYLEPSLDSNTMVVERGTTARLVAIGGDWLMLTNESNGSIAYGLSRDFESYSPTQAPTSTPVPTPEPTKAVQPFTPAADNTYGRVLEDNVLVYPEPDEESSFIALFYENEVVRVTAYNDEWVCVRLTDANGSTDGYMLRRCVEPYTPPAVTAEPTPVPTVEPTPVPTAEPTPVPTAEPTPVPTAEPTPVPTAEPTPVPTAEPTPVPTAEPTPVPTAEPTPVPTPEPSDYDPTWVYDSKKASNFVQALINTNWLPVDTSATGVENDTVYAAISRFQKWYNANVANELTLVENPDGTFTDAYGNYNPIDELTYKAIMSRQFFNW